MAPLAMAPLFWEAPPSSPPGLPGPPWSHPHEVSSRQHRQNLSLNPSSVNDPSWFPSATLINKTNNQPTNQPTNLSLLCVSTECRHSRIPDQRKKSELPTDICNAAPEI